MYEIIKEHIGYMLFKIDQDLDLVFQGLREWVIFYCENKGKI